MVSKSFRLQKLQQLKLQEPRGDLGKAHKKTPEKRSTKLTGTMSQTWVYSPKMVKYLLQNEIINNT